MSGGLSFPVAWIFVLVLIGIWEVIWKGKGLWKSGRNNQLMWFVFILIFNTVGILPIVYLVWFQKRKKVGLAVKKRRR